MKEIQINQEENEDLLYNPGHYYGSSNKDQERFDAVVIDDDSEDWRVTVKKHIAAENQRSMQPTKSYFELGLL